jgi:hypothetical protein
MCVKSEAHVERFRGSHALARCEKDLSNETQAVFWSAINKLSGGSASSGVNRESKRKWERKNAPVRTRARDQPDMALEDQS